jgi:uncharacterized repeat protein (TIGR01451 family)
MPKLNKQPRLKPDSWLARLKLGAELFLALIWRNLKNFTNNFIKPLAGGGVSPTGQPNPKYSKKINPRWRRRLKSFGLTLWGFVVVVGVTSVAINLLLNEVFDTAKAATINSVSIDKKYYNGSSEVDSITVGSGQTVKVRLKYDTLNTSSSTGVNIADTLPSGFTYIPGSIKNCYVDASCVVLNDSLVSGSNISVAPGAGYFGYATNATSSNLELGRRKFVTQQDCRYNYVNGADNDNYYTYRIQFVSSTSNTATCPGAPNGSYTTQNTSTIERNSTGFRYLAQTNCRYSKSGDDVYGLFGVLSFQNSSSLASNCSSVSGYTTTASTPIVRDMLGFRYLHQRVCEYVNTGSNVDRRGLYDVISINNTATATATCNSISGYTTTTSTSLDYDMSDTARGYGYIEYDMLAPSLSGSYGTSVSMTGSFNGTALTQTKPNSITVNHNATIAKKYYTGAGEVDSLKVPPSGRVKVRLKYNNADLRSHTGVNITDSMPSGFTYVPGSIKNCYSDTSCATLDDALFSGSNLSVAPGAGYFGYATNATSSNLELGRYKNFILHTCFYYLNGGADYFISHSPAFTGSGFNFGAPTKFSNSDTDSATCSAGSSSYLSSDVNTPITLPLNGRRYLHISNCLYVNTNDYFFNAGQSDSGLNYDASTGFDNLATRDLGCGGGNAFWVLANGGQPGFTLDLDVLGQRYFHLHTCYFAASGDTVSSIANSTNGYDAPTKFSLFPTDSNSGCAGNGTYVFSSRNLNSYDMSDTSRGYGYIEYEMDAPETEGLYGTNAAMSGSFSGTSLTAAKPNSITVGYSPAASLQKEYSLDGISWSTTVNARRGQAVYVRLKYDNTGDGPANNVRITDSIPSGATLIDGSVTNTMADGTPINLPDSVFSGGTNLSISPSAGFFGNSTTATSGNLVPGRKKYFSISQCAFYYLTTDIVSGHRFNVGSGGFSGPITNPTFTNTQVTDTTCYLPDSNWLYRGGTNIANVDVTGKRYVSFGQCAYYFPTGNNYTGGQIFFNGSQNDGSTYNPFASNSPYIGGGCTGDSVTYYSWSGINNINFDVINNRYLHIAECYYYISSDILGGFVADAGGYGPNYDPYTDNKATSYTNNCKPVSGASEYFSVHYQNVDMLDTARGYGYIQYAMTMGNTIAGGTYGSTATLFDTDTTKEFTDQTSGSNTNITIASLNATLTKQYSVDGTNFFDSINAKKGQNIWVRLKYNNADSVSGNNIRITDSLPANFSLVSGSVKNSYVDAPSVTLPDSLFSGSNLTTSPAAGYLGFSTNATSSALEMGKKKNLYYTECVYIPRGAVTGGLNGQNFSFNYDLAGTNYGGFAYDPAVGNSDTTPNTCGGGDSNWYLESGPWNVVANMTGKQNFIFQECLTNETSGGIRLSGVNDYISFTTAYGDRFSFDPYFTTGSAANLPCLDYASRSYSGLSRLVTVDTLGKRYLNLSEGVYRNRANQIDSLAYHTNLASSGDAPEGNTGFCPDPTATHIPTTLTCRNGDSVLYKQLDYNRSVSLDLLDIARGYGHIEYQMKAGSQAAYTTYGTTATLLDNDINSEFSSQSSSGSLSIVAPEISFTKQYSTDGVNFNNTLTASTGQQIWVRLNYNNYGSVAVNNAQIRDSLPSSFSLVSGSLKNQYVDADPVSLPNSVFSGSNLTIAPVAGYFGYSTTDTAGILEMGKKRYFHQLNCSKDTGAYVTYSVGVDTSHINAPSNSQVTYTGSDCFTYLGEYFNTSLGTANYVDPNSSNMLVTGNRYLQKIYCSGTDAGSSGTADDRLFGISNQALSNALCADYFGGRATWNSASVDYIDTLGFRYVNGLVCQGGVDHPGISGTRDIVYSVSANPDTASSPLCANAFGPGYASAQNAFTYSHDLLDTGRGYGYIEYKMSTTQVGQHGTNSILEFYDYETTTAQRNSGTTTDLTIVPAIVYDGLQLYYDVTNTSSYSGSGQTVTDLSGNNNNATLGKTSAENANDPTFQSSGIKRFSFNSANDQFLETSLNSAFSSSFTAEFWASRANNNDTAGSSVQQRLFTKFSSGQSSSAIALGTQGTTIQTLANGTTYNSTFIPNTSWQHVVLTYDNATNTGRMYVNSVLQSTFTQTLPTNSSPGDIKIGIFDETQSTQTSRRGYNGDISKVRIYNRVLSGSEVLNNFDIESATYGFTGNSLGVSVPSSASFTSRTVSAGPQTSTAFVESITYTDRRASFVPWTSSIAMSNCVASGGVITANNLSISVGGITTTMGSGLNNSAGGSGSFTAAGVGRTLISNSSGNGGGVFTLSPELGVSIPAYSKAGTYVCTATISTA